MKKTVFAGVLVAAVVAAGAVAASAGWVHSASEPQSRTIKVPDYISRQMQAIASMHQEFPTDADIVFVGDSRVQLAPWADMFPHVPVGNRGVGSDTLVGLLGRVDQMGVSTPQVVLMEMGVNDVLLRRPVDEAAAAADKVLSHLQDEAGRVVVLEVIDCASEGCNRQDVAALNRHLRGLANRHGAQFIRLNDRFSGPEGLLPAFSYDGLHLNAKGYRMLAEVLCGQVPELQCGAGRTSSLPSH